MHLTAADCGGGVGLLSCTHQWLFKSQTAFYQADDWHLPWYFGLLCWSYAVAGLVLLATTTTTTTTAPHHHHKNQRPQHDDDASMTMTRQQRFGFPRYAYALFLIFIQAPLSFLADYINMDQDSIFHVIDRFAALHCAGLELWRFYDLLLLTQRRSSIFWYVVFTTAGLQCFFRSQTAQAAHDRDNFILFHNLWHFYPLCTSTVVLFDHYLVHFHCTAKKSKCA